MARRPALFLTAWLACAGAHAQVAAPQPSVATAIAGILSYTRWPAAADAAAVRLCTLGRGAAVEEIQRSAEIGSAQRSVTIRALASVAQVRGACDAVYLAGQEPALGRELLKATAGQPVLVLGEGAEFCSDGGMFCLEPATTSVRFGANLDAIARSGLRVHPMVLRIARGTPGAAP